MSEEEIDIHANLEANRYKDDEDENSPFIEQTAFNSFKSGVEFAQRKMYSEDEVLELLLKGRYTNYNSLDTKMWFKTVKKK